MMHVLLKIIGWECRCRVTTRVFSDGQGYYVRCLDCGRRLPYCGPMAA
jgi:ribosomal protein S27E